MRKTETLTPLRNMSHHVQIQACSTKTLHYTLFRYYLLAICKLLNVGHLSPHTPQLPEQKAQNIK